MLIKLEDLERKFNEIEARLGAGDFNDPKELTQLNKEHKKLAAIVQQFQAYKIVRKDIESCEEMIKDEDSEIRDMAKREMAELQAQDKELYKALELALIPPDPDDEKNIYIEIRAGTGGDEAALFAADLFRMYAKFAEGKKWKVNIISSNELGIGGFKEIIASIEGENVYSNLKYERGTHRVQRVPATETMGRIHTSAVTVAVMVEVDDVEIEIDAADVRVDVYRASGAGGQHVNKTESAVRLTHLPSGIVVQCQDSRSQIKNKEMAMKVLKARLYERIEKERADSMGKDRKAQVGSGDRSEKIRTYNFPQGRVTDHRISLTLHKLDQIMNGQLDEIVLGLSTHEQMGKLQNMKSES